MGRIRAGAAGPDMDLAMRVWGQAAPRARALHAARATPCAPLFAWKAWTEVAKVAMKTASMLGRRRACSTVSAHGALPDGGAAELRRQCELHASRRDKRPRQRVLAKVGAGFEKRS
jgi:hypothetical protein